jgi:hypothetical protein
MVSVKEDVSPPAEAGLRIHQGRLIWVRKLDNRDHRGGHCNEVGIRVPICQFHGGVYGFQGIDSRLRAFPQLKGGQTPQIVSIDVTPGERSNDLEKRSDHT